MAYNIVLTNGQNLVTVADGTTDTNFTSLTLVGKNFAGYGLFQNQNFVKMLENFSNTTAPNAPLKGQIWWDDGRKVLQVYTGSEWKAVSSSTSSTTSPPNPVTGDLWWDTATGQFKVWGGTSWIVIGPAFTSSSQTGAVPDVVTGSVDATQHNIVKFFASGVLVSVLSHDPTFDVNSLTGFTQLSPGFNMATGHQFVGDSTNALKLNGISSASFLRGDQQSTTNYKLTINSNDGLVVGGGGELAVSIVGNAINYTSTIAGRDASFYVNVAGTGQRALNIGGADALLTVFGDPTVPLGVATKQYADTKVSKTGDIMTGPLTLSAAPTSDLQAATKKYVDDIVGGSGGGSLLARDGSNTIIGNILPDLNNVRNFGSGAAKFNTIYATTFNGNATSANFADLAERFAADAVYAPGTLVKIGGTHEVTLADAELSDEVFGVVSTNPAYLMNAEAGTNETHPPIAAQGRVPVRVVGKVSKGDRLVSAGGGAARAATIGEWSAFNVIGRALQNKDTAGEGLVEAVVRSNV